MRELRHRAYHPGLKQWVEMDIVTTLLDEGMYPPERLLDLRLQRWQVVQAVPSLV